MIPQTTGASQPCTDVSFILIHGIDRGAIRCTPSRRSVAGDVFAAPFIVFLFGSGAWRRRVFPPLRSGSPSISNLRSTQCRSYRRGLILWLRIISNAPATSGAHESDIQRSRIFLGVFSAAAFWSFSALPAQLFCLKNSRKRSAEKETPLNCE